LPQTWRRLACSVFLTMLLVASTLAADTDPRLLACRGLREAKPAEAIADCESAAEALQLAADVDGAFEALMHAAQAAAHLGEAARAEAVLDRASALVSQVRDPLAAHRVARRRGLAAYQDRRPLDALPRFLDALTAARRAEDAAARAVSDNDLGVVYRHLGDLPAALEHFRASLEQREALGDVNLGSTLANVGSLYLQLGDQRRAGEYLERARASHAAAAEPLLEAQTIEELAHLAEASGDPALARQRLDQAWQGYETIDSPRDRLRLALYRARLELTADEPDTARHWLNLARAQAQALKRDVPLEVATLEAQLARGALAQRAAYEHLQTALAAADAHATGATVDAAATLASLAEALGDDRAALRHARDQHRLGVEIDRRRHDERLDALRVRFEVAQLESERDRLARRGARQEMEIARRRLQTLWLAAAALLVIGAVALLSQRRLYRQRLRAQQAEARLEQGIARLRQSADRLRSDLRSTAWLLDRQQVAALVFDASGRIAIATDAAAARVGQPAAQLAGADLADVLGREFANQAQSWIENSSLQSAPGEELSLSLPAGRGEARLRRLALEEELGVLSFDARDDRAAPGDLLAAGADHVDDNAEAVSGNDDLRVLLVRLMQETLDIWERVTRKSRLELAEASGIWRITIDDGRLRVRTLDRYLALDTLPDRPRWREVLRTAYYVLAELPLSAAQRECIEASSERVLALTRRRPA
jgi:two-component system sensor histidine kinase ChiS